MDAVRERWSAMSTKLKAACAAIVLLLAVVPFVTTAFVTEIVLTGLVFAILGLSWNLLGGYAGQISLGHHAFFGIGAFVTAWLSTPSGAGLPESIAVPGLVAVVLGAVGATLLALVTGPILFRLRGHYFAIGTLALAAIIRLVLLDQRRFSGGSTGYYLNETTGEIVVYLVTLAVAVATLAVTYQLVNSKPGLGMQAIHGDEEAASSLGVNPLKYKMYAFVVSTLLAGLAGGLYAQFTLYINPESTLAVTWTIDALVIVILGGMGTILGPLLGTVLFLGLDNLLGEVVGGLATSVEGILIILFIIYLPQGLYGFLTDEDTEIGLRRFRDWFGTDTADE